MQDENDGGSAPCFAPLLVDGQPVDPGTARDVARFRRAERARLLSARALSVKERERATAALIAGLDRIMAPEPGMSIAVYWPIRGEPDLRSWMVAAHAAGAEVLLPVVVEKDAPLEFHTWFPTCPMTLGHWNILVPENGEAGVPNVVVAPLVGVDHELYRLGNGGGYYDRTLARLEPRPHVIGVGFTGCTLPTIQRWPGTSP